MIKNPAPPKWAQRFLSWYCRPELLEDLQGDLNEYFNRNSLSKGQFKAKLIYILDVFKFLRSYTIRKSFLYDPHLHWILYKNYFTTAQRNLRKYKLNTALNIAGLTLGISCFIIISLYVHHELSFDKHYKNLERIYRVTFNFRSLDDNQITALAWADAPLLDRLNEHFPEIEAVTGIAQIRNFDSSSGSQTKVKSGTHTFIEDRFFVADSSYFNVFSHDWIAGNPSTALTRPASIVLTQGLALKYFQDTDPLDKSLIINNRNYLVTGVIEDLPENTDLKFDALLSLDSHFSDWCFTYILFRNANGAAGFQQKLDTLFEEEVRPVLQQSNFDGSYHLEALRGLHFAERKLFDPPKGNQASLYVFTAISLLILIISAFNYINLSVAQSVKRQAEVGIRKIFGAVRKQIRMRYTVESLMITVVSIVFAGAIVFYVIPILKNNHILNYSIEELNDVSVVSLLIAIVFLICVTAGSLPSYYLSRTDPVANLKGKTRIGDNRSFRNGLIIVQFTASISLIFATGVVYDQMAFLLQKDTSLEKDQVLVVDIPDDETLLSTLPVLKNAVKALAFVKNASLVGENSIPTSEPTMDIFEVNQNGKKTIKMLNYIRIDEDYFDVLGLTMSEGRKFNARDFDSDNNVVVVNEGLVKLMGWKNPLQQTVGSKSIVGVVRDFSFQALQQAGEPMMVVPNNHLPQKLLVKVTSPDSKSIAVLQNTWKQNLKDLPFTHRFLDEYFSQQLEKENTLQKLMTWFSSITVVIACLGLFGLISISIVQRMKETGIRKIFGARVIQLLALTWKEYGILLAISSIIAFPLVFFSMTKWLEGFANKTSVGIGEYFTAVGVMVAVMLFTLLYQAWKLIKINPIQSIRYE